MIDIIIPSYNNEKGLFDTLFSIGTENFGQKVYIIDDCSTEEINYDRIVQIFEQFYHIEIIKLEKNIGPGMVRQKGIEITSSKYITFLDCGDKFLNDISLLKTLNFLNEENNINVFAPQHLEEYPNLEFGIVYASNNRFHGKIFRRDFLEKYKISFCPEGSYSNEDIGFNFLCRWICEYLDEGIIFEENLPYVIWKNDENSLTRKNDYSFFYKNNKGLYLNIKHVFNHLKKLGLTEDIFLSKIYYIFCNLYISFIGTVNKRPDCIEDSLFGIKNFYLDFLKNKTIDYKLFTSIYFDVLQDNVFNNTFSHPYLAKITDFNILQFMAKLNQGEL